MAMDPVQITILDDKGVGAMYLYLPVALTSINILVPVGLGLAVGLLSGLFGVGGGFLMTPLLLMAGIPSTVAAARDSNQIVAAASSGAFAHWRLGNVDFKMGLIILAGGIFGGTIGVQLVKLLRSLGNFEFVMKVVYVLMLGLVGGVVGALAVAGYWPHTPLHAVATDRYDTFAMATGPLASLHR